MIFDINIVNQLIRSRRSLYPQTFNGEIIPQEIISTILENANWAPTHGLTEPWRFNIFHGDGLKKLADFQSSCYKEYTPENAFKQHKYEGLKTKPLQCSHVISIGMHRQESGKIPEIEEIEATACAVQNMYLTATAYGLGCYWGSGGVTYFEAAKPFFNLRPQDKLLGFFHLGYPKIAWPEGRRTPIDEKITWVNS